MARGVEVMSIEKTDYKGERNGFLFCWFFLGVGSASRGGWTKGQVRGAGLKLWPRPDEYTASWLDVGNVAHAKLSFFFVKQML